MAPYDLEPSRPHGLLSRLDDGLLVGAVIVAALFVFHLVGWLMGGLVLMVKIAIIVALTSLIVGRLRRRSQRW